MKTCAITLLMLAVCLGYSNVKASPLAFTALLKQFHNGEKLTKAEMTTIVDDLAKRFGKTGNLFVSRSIWLGGRDDLNTACTATSSFTCLCGVTPCVGYRLVCVASFLFKYDRANRYSFVRSSVTAIHSEIFKIILFYLRYRRRSQYNYIFIEHHDAFANQPLSYD